MQCMNAILVGNFPSEFTHLRFTVVVLIVKIVVSSDSESVCALKVEFSAMFEIVDVFTVPAYRHCF